jgi:hypothetical protein
MAGWTGWQDGRDGRMAGWTGWILERVSLAAGMRIATGPSEAGWKATRMQTGWRLSLVERFLDDGSGNGVVRVMGSDPSI